MYAGPRGFAGGRATMRLHTAIATGAAGLLLALGMASAAPAQQVDGGALYAARCKSCHEPPVVRAPGREQLRGLSNEHIIEALSNGIMKPMATGLSPAEIGGIASFL